MSILSGNKYKKKGIEKLEKLKDSNRRELIGEMVRLHNKVARLEASEKELRHVKEMLQKKTHALGERVKELNCLYAISGLVEEQDISLERILAQIVTIIPPAWQFPEITEARLVVWHKTFATEYYKDTAWKQSADIMVKDRKAGVLEVVYRDEKPESDEGPFLREERSLVNLLAKRIGEIIEQKMAEDALKESLMRNKALLNAIPDIIFRVRKDGIILDFKKGKGLPARFQVKRLVGKTIEELPDYFGVLSRELVRQIMRNVEQVLKSGETQIYEHHIAGADEIFHYEILLTVSGDDEVLGIARDITERRRLEKQVIEISEREQQRIGQDLHDSLCQQLTGVAFLGKVLEKKLKTKAHEEYRDVHEIVSLIDDAITETKGLSRGLYPVRLEAKGLMTALTELAKNVKKLFAIECAFSYDRPVLVHDNILAIHLYRIAQEAVNNAIKHAKAKHIQITFSDDRGATVLAIRNDGLSFRKPGRTKPGMGMSIMKHRAGMIGAALDIRSEAKGDTIVTCSFQIRPTLRGRRGES